MSDNPPFVENVKAGCIYYLCTCSLSQKLPYCDGAHKGSGMKPIVFKAEKDESVTFCGCSKNPIKCDGSSNS